MNLRTGIIGTVVAASLTASSLASAAPETSPTPEANLARADALFTAAKQLRDAGLYEDACPKFAETEELEPGVGVSLYLADCYQHTGRSANAWAEFRKAEKLALDRKDKRADVARARADALEAKLTRLTIAVSDPEKHVGLEITVDGTRIRPDSWNAMLPTDPGAHAVAIAEPGQPARTLNVHLDEGSNLTVPIFESPGVAPAPSAAPSTPAPAAATEPAPDAPVNRSGAVRTYVGIGLLGAGAVSVAIGAAYLDAKNDAISRNRRSSAGTYAGVWFGVGAAAFASSIVLYLTAPKDPTTALTLSATPIASGGAASLQGSF